MSAQLLVMQVQKLRGQQTQNLRLPIRFPHLQVRRAQSVHLHAQQVD